MMKPTTNQPDFFDSKVLGHPAGLFVLFFTEMWERFSFYGMRVLLVNFLTMAVISYNPGWEWVPENATALFGTYAMLLYITPILGGIIADKLTGYNWAVVIGSILMTAGHASMALETEASLYIGLGLIIIGTGFFKPNITSIISEMYKFLPEKKDGAYTIFYMGVNAGAFFGMLLCGYLAEKLGWAYGFGLAGVFMLLGTLQFWLAKPLFGSIGDVPKKRDVEDKKDTGVELSQDEKDQVKPNPFTTLDKILIVLSAIIGLGYAINDPMSKIADFDMFAWAETPSISGQYVVVLLGLGLFLILVIGRIIRYAGVVRDRMIAFIIFAFFTVFFWMSFEQGASSLIIFARDFVDRTLSGSAAIAYNVINTALTIIPLLIITYVLYMLSKRSFSKIPGSNIVLAITFLGVWALTLWMLNRDWNTNAYEVSYQAVEQQVVEDGKPKVDDNDKPVYEYIPISENYQVQSDDKVVDKTVRLAETYELEVGQEIPMITKDNVNSTFGYLTPEKLKDTRLKAEKLNVDNKVIKAEVVEVLDNEIEIPVSWFSILNSFFIIAFASFFSKWFDSKYNPSATMKYGLGLIIMAIGFGVLAWGSHGIQEGMKVGMVWLVLAYLFHTLGELCSSPIGLSYVSKLVPARMIALMFGMWYLAIAIGNKLAAVFGGEIENITEEYSLSTFFLIFTIVPAAFGLLIISLGKVVNKLMHGVK
ncbi:peptide MFS transporter [Mesohalobacter halotolerans]|uniref:Peptide MFS transporter n=2 Tax=Mesohalobacter halotolerans TaxID=1883405 RepID=A0A4U5TSY1_9FLAO|nr:peptide MFS transporter [Mesohalobacter halotolerans]